MRIKIGKMVLLQIFLFLLCLLAVVACSSDRRIDGKHESNVSTTHDDSAHRKMSVSPKRDKESVKVEIKAKIKRLKATVEQWYDNEPPRGVVAVSFHISSDGKLKAYPLSSSFKHNEFEALLLRQINSWTFTPGDSVTLVYPVQF